MKTEVVQSLCPAATGNYDITGSSPSGDMVGAIFLPAGSITANTNIATGRWSFGATDLTNNICMSIAGQDALAAGTIRSMMSRSKCLFTANALGSNSPPVASYASTLSNGVRLTTTAVTANRITSALLISGGDCSMQVGQQYFAAGDTTHDIAHSFGAAPDVIIILTCMDVPSSADETDGDGMAIGFWDRQSAAQTSVSFRATDVANPTDQAGYASNASVAEILTASADAAHVTLTGANTTKFTLGLSASLATNHMFGWIALRGITAQLNAKNLLATLPTGIGVASLVTGMVGRPQCVIVLPTRLTTGNIIARDDTSGSLGVSCLATNDYSATTQGAVAATFKDGVTPSVAKTMLTANGLLSTDNTGAVRVAATVNTWNTDGVDLNYTVVGASAFQAAVLAFGLTPPATTLAYPYSRTQFFVNDAVTYS